MRKTMLAAFAAALCLAAQPARAGDAATQLTPEQKAEFDKQVALARSLRPMHGEAPLPDARARLVLGSGYYFLGPADAKKVMVDAWNNPPESTSGVLGIVFPEGKSFLDSTWGAVVTYEATDFVPDADTKTADYDHVLGDMRATEAEDNQARKNEGFPLVHLVGWAQAPSYDPSHQDLIWARELTFSDREEHTLNYEVRHLGRNGVLSLTMVATMQDLPEVRTAARALARTAEFDVGSRYVDHLATDKSAGYGLAGLVAAGAGLVVAKKAGLLVVLLAFAKKGIALIVAALAGLAAWFGRRFGKTPDLPPAERALPETEKDEAA